MRGEVEDNEKGLEELNGMKKEGINGKENMKEKKGKEKQVTLITN